MAWWEHKTAAEAALAITRTNVNWNAVGENGPIGPWENYLGRPLSITYGFRASSPPYNSNGYDLKTGFFQFSLEQRASTIQALQAWADVANIDFDPINGAGNTDNATMLFGNYVPIKVNPVIGKPEWDTQAGAFGIGPDRGGRRADSPAGDFWVSSTSALASYAPGQPGYSLLLHEIGHTLGLQHPAGYDASDIDPGTGKPRPLNYQALAGYAEDTKQFSIMSYFSAHENRDSGADFRVRDGAGKIVGEIPPSTPMMHDIAAIQRLYGANWDTRKTDTIYGFNSNAGDAYSLQVNADGSVTLRVFCVWDGGGRDTLDFSGYWQDQQISLVAGTFSNVGSLKKNVSIAEGVVIEDAKGGAGADIITGNEVDNEIWGNGGGDTISGAGGRDTLHGGEGVDTLSGGALADTLYGDGDTDHLWGEGGRDWLYGGAGNDDMHGGEGGDVLFGEAGEDTLEGGSEGDFLAGEDGNDTLIGGAGNDTLDGGDGADWAGFSDAIATVIVDLGRGGAIRPHATGTEIGNDTLISIENVSGGWGNDYIYGDAKSNVIDGGPGGDDSLYGFGDDDRFVRLTGNDRIVDGGADSDTVDFSFISWNTPVTINLGDGGRFAPPTPYAQSELGRATLKSIENAIGGSGDDRIVGNGDANRLDGGPGIDTLSGAGGADFLFGGFGGDPLDGRRDLLDGGGGNDDTADYSATSQGVEVWLDSHVVWGAGGRPKFSGPSAAGAEIGTDTLRLIENATGGSGVDTLHGNDRANVLDGGTGADTMEGRGGDDEYYVDNGGSSVSGPGGVSVTRGDEVIELTDDGIDTVHSSLFTYTLVRNVENLVLAPVPELVSILLPLSLAFNGTGNELSNRITGNGLGNILLGVGGRDELIGGDGFDALYGGDGMVGDGADDTLTGGLHADIYYYRDGDGTDTVTDFNFVEGDRIDLTGVFGVYRLSDLTMTQAGADTVITIGSGGLVLRNVVKDALTDAQFVFNPSPDIDLSAAAVAENSAAGTVVGRLSATNLISVGWNTKAFSLLDDAGGRFSIDGSNNLVVAGPLDYETAAAHDIKVRVTYPSGNFYVETFTIGVTDVAETIRGSAGNDNIDVLPGSGIEAVEAGAGNDIITIAPGAGAVVVDAGTGNDVIKGNGETILSYVGSTVGITHHTGSMGGHRQAVMKNLATGEVTPLQTRSGETDLVDFVSSVNPVFSPDGSKIALVSTAALVPGGRGGTWDVYVKDLATGQNSLVSTSAAGALANNNSYSNHYPVAWSPDGSKIAFMSSATNLVPGDTNGLTDIFIKTIGGPNAGAIERVSTGTGGVEASDATRGVAGFLDGSYGPKFSPDGNLLLFWSSADNFAVGDSNGKADVFLKVLAGTDAGTTYLISRDAAGVIGDGQSLDASFSPDGNSVVFASNAVNLGARSATSSTSIFVKDISAVYAGDDPSNGALTKIPGFLGQGMWPTFSPDGGKILYYNGQIFIYDLATATNTVVSSSAAGVNGSTISQFAAWSADGSKVTFLSTASNLVPGDTNGAIDIFVKTVSGPGAGSIERVSVGADGVEGNANSLLPVFSPTDSNIIVFQTDANNIYATDSNGNDKFSGIAAVWGSQFDDRLLGSTASNTASFRGNAGNDLIQGLQPADEADYSNSPGGITVNVSVVPQGNGWGTAKDGWGTVDTLRGIENIRGSELADVVNMDDVANRVWGNGGNDTIHAAGGNDGLDGGAGEDTLAGGRGSDALTGGMDADTFVFQAAQSQAGDVDIVTDLVIGEDHLRFEGLTVTELTQADVNGDAVTDTALTFSDGSVVQFLNISGIGDWAIPLLNANGGM